VLHTERFIGHVAQIKSHENAGSDWVDEETVPEQELQDDAVSDPGVEDDEETDYSRIATGAGDAVEEIDQDLAVQGEVDQERVVPDVEQPESEKSSSEDEEEDATLGGEPANGSEDDDGEDYGEDDDDYGVF
jgi:hypothetical protein